MTLAGKIRSAFAEVNPKPPTERAPLPFIPVPRPIVRRQYRRPADVLLLTEERRPPLLKLPPEPLEARLDASDRGSVVVVRPMVREPVRGPGAILAYLGRRGVTVRLAPDGSMYVMHEKGYGEELERIVNNAWRLLQPFLAGTPASCAWCPSPAMTVLGGGALSCGVHPEPEELPE